MRDKAPVRGNMSALCSAGETNASSAGETNASSAGEMNASNAGEMKNASKQRAKKRQRVQFEVMETERGLTDDEVRELWRDENERRNTMFRETFARTNQFPPFLQWSTLLTPDLQKNFAHTKRGTFAVVTDSHFKDLQECATSGNKCAEMNDAKKQLLQFLQDTLSPHRQGNLQKRTICVRTVDIALHLFRIISCMNLRNDVMKGEKKHLVHVEQKMPEFVQLMKSVLTAYENGEGGGSEGKDVKGESEKQRKEETKQERKEEIKTEHQHKKEEVEQSEMPRITGSVQVGKPANLHECMQLWEDALVQWKKSMDITNQSHVEMQIIRNEMHQSQEFLKQTVQSMYAKFQQENDALRQENARLLQLHDKTHDLAVQALQESKSPAIPETPAFVTLSDVVSDENNEIYPSFKELQDKMSDVFENDMKPLDNMYETDTLFNFYENWDNSMLELDMCDDA